MRTSCLMRPHWPLSPLSRSLPQHCIALTTPRPVSGLRFLVFPAHPHKHLHTHTHTHTHAHLKCTCIHTFPIRDALLACFSTVSRCTLARAHALSDIHKCVYICVRVQMYTRSRYQALSELYDVRIHTHVCVSQRVNVCGLCVCVSVSGCVINVHNMTGYIISYSVICTLQAPLPGYKPLAYGPASCKSLSNPVPIRPHNFPPTHTKPPFLRISLL